MPTATSVPRARSNRLSQSVPEARASDRENVQPSKVVQPPPGRHAARPLAAISESAALKPTLQARSGVTSGLRDVTNTRKGTSL